MTRPAQRATGVASLRDPQDAPVRPVTVLHLLAPARVGGLERVVQALALGHARRGHHVHVAPVISEGGADHPFLAPLRDSDVDLHPLVLADRAYGRELRAVAALCRSLRPDVVHTHGYRVDVLDAGVARRMGIPVVTTVHGFTRGGWKNSLYEWLQRRAFRRFDAVVAVSRPLATELRHSGVSPERLHFVPNAWGGEIRDNRTEARAELGVADGTFLVGWVGRLEREKGADVLIDALSHVRDLPLCAVVIGEGSERDALEARARRLGVEDRIRWAGRVADATSLFAAFDTFTLSSRTEGTPIVLLEAMAAGVPIIATGVGGVPDVVTPREALLVPPENPLALGAAIRAAWTQRGESAMRARAARARLATHFSVGPWLRRYEEVYAAIAGVLASNPKPLL